MSKYHVYYARRPTFHPSGEFGTPRLTVAALQSSHVLLQSRRRRRRTGTVTASVPVCEIEAGSLDDAFWQMQGENWSPHGEARALLQSLGLSHTSMSVGDVLQDEEGTYWECLDRGWRPVEDDTQEDDSHGQA